MIERTFSPDDQEAFATLSGDRNPIHLDPVAARRLIFGGQVAHGVHVLLWGLNELARGAPNARRFRAVRARFRKSIPVDTTVQLRVVGREADQATLQIELQGRRAATIRVHFSSAGDEDTPEPSGDRPACSTPRELRDDELEDARGSVLPCLDRELASRLFPDVLRGLSSLQLAQLLATTRIVGMECPGLHSLYSELEVEFEPSAACAPLAYEVTGYDARFKRVELALAGAGVRGSVTAFLRPPPREQVAAALITDVSDVIDGEFAGHRVLVIGGSRGLGEVAAKLVAAGGAKVKLTYFRGREDACKVVEDIAAAGGQAEALDWDVLLEPDRLRIGLDGWVPTLVCYFASPFIAARSDFSRDLFARFCDYYVSGFVNTLDALGEPGPEGFRVLYPSSVFVEDVEVADEAEDSTRLDERPQNLLEYTTAKSAGEALCGALQRQRENLRISAPRLPRMATDQTQSLFGAEAADPLPVLLKELRRLRDL